MTTNRYRWAGLLGVALAVSAVGCQRGPTLVPVSGQLTLGKKPLTVARVQFVPDRAKGNEQGRDARGKVDETGTYTLTTDDKPGVIPGWYKVAVFAFEEVPLGGGPKPPVWLAPMHYADLDKSGLSVEVTADPTPDQYDFDLKP